MRAVTAPEARLLYERSETPASLSAHGARRPLCRDERVDTRPRLERVAARSRQQYARAELEQDVGQIELLHKEQETLHVRRLEMLNRKRLHLHVHFALRARELRYLARIIIIVAEE